MIEEALKGLEGYLISIKRDTTNGWYVLEIGLPSDWIYKGNEIVDCNEIAKTDMGVLLTISPKKVGITIDDLISFVELIIETNSRIVAKEKEFTDKMEEVKQKLAEQAKEFYSELDEIREKSFSKFEIKKIDGQPALPITQLSDKPKVKRGRGRPKGSKNKPKTENVGEEKTEQKDSVD